MISYGLIQKLYGDKSGADLLKPLITQVFPGRIALVSSFGAESAVLTHMVASIDPATPVLFMDTGRLFAETLAYRDTLIAHLGLTNVITVKPSEEDEHKLDPNQVLFQADSDACCEFRKVIPMERALRGYQAWITGRKRFHGGDRHALSPVETADWRVKINPLATWAPADIADYFKAHDLPRHPLVDNGYPSIGCMPCTSPVGEGEDFRAGRWRGQEKTECGIHWTLNGQPIRETA